MNRLFSACVVAVLALFLGSPAFAQTPISGLPAASALTGTELVPIVQGGVTSKAAASSFSTYVASLAHSWAGNQTFAAGSTTIPPIVLSSGINLTLPIAGAFEWDGASLSVTQTSGPTRKVLGYADFSNAAGALAIVNGGTGNTSAAAALSALGGAPLASPTFTGKVTTAASGSGSAGLNLPQGAAPTSPADGDFWTTTAGAFARINGSTVSLGSVPGYTLISTLTASGSSSLTWSSVSTTYKDLKLIMNGIACTDVTNIRLNFVDSGSATIGPAVGSDASSSAHYGVALIPNWQDSSVAAYGFFYTGSRPNAVPGVVTVMNTSGNLVTAVLQCLTGTIATGSASLYGR